MVQATQNLGAAWRTAQRAGLRRSLYRAQRILRLRVLDPVLGPHIYARRPISTATAPIGTVSRLLGDIARHRGVTADSWDVDAGTVKLLNQAPMPLSWSTHPPLEDPLWSFRLHSWDWAWRQCVPGSDAPAVWKAMQDWSATVPVGQRPGWEPYPVSRRVVVWTAAWHLLGGESWLASAIHQQARYLADHLERDLDNNHLVANAKALAWAGLLLPRADQAQEWRGKGLELLWATIRQQVRRDGGHIENALSYHFTVMADGLETALLCRALNVPVPQDIWGKLGAMVAYASILRRPDGTFPLLNDSVVDEPYQPDALLQLGKDACVETEEPNKVTPQQAESTATLLSDSGLVVLRSEDSSAQTHLVLDYGDLGPDHCPGHGHADTLGFELWSRGRPLIVDPGTYQYAAGGWRDYFRSTRVHNTAEVDGENQSTFHGAFRVGHLAHGKLLDAQIDKLPYEVLAQHDGYTRLRDPVLHRRHLMWWGASHITVRDDFMGRETHRVRVTYHLAPCKVTLHSSTVAVATFEGGVALRVSIQGPRSGRLSMEPGWLSTTWYEREETSVLTYSFTERLPESMEAELVVL